MASFGNNFGEFVPNPGGPSCGLTDPHECCTFFGHLDYLFCLSFCVFCCMECDVGKIVKNGLSLPPPKSRPEPALDRDYENFTVVNGTIGFTTSEYGKFIPIVFGSDKLTGNVIWSSDFETKQFTSGDTIYQYSTVSFALGVCEGEIDAVLRLWLGDQLIFDKTMSTDVNNVAQPGADGFILGMIVDLVSPDSPLKDLADGARLTKITVFNGAETQLPEGVIVAKEGYAETPAYRGLAYILFENMVVTEAVPNIFVEVLANVNPIFPRVFGNLPTPQTFFDDIGPALILHEPSYDRLIVSAQDSSGSGDVPNGAGYAVFDGNRLDALYQRELEVTENLPDLDALDPGFLFPLHNGNWLVYSKLLGAGTVIVYDPTSGARVATLGPAGNVLDNGFPNGFGYLINASGTLRYPVKNVPVDIFYGVHIQGHVGWAIIQPDNTIEMVSNTDDILPGGGATGGGASVPITYTTSFSDDNPAFSDGAATEGAHVYFFSNRGNVFDDKRIYVTRATISGTGSVYDPVYTQLGNISYNAFNGEEYQHILDTAMLDDSDGCIVLLIRSTRGDWIAKWSPFTATFKWKTPVTGGLWSQTRQAGPMALLWGPSYWFIGNDQKIYFIDLTTGIIEDKGTLTSQLLPGAEENQQFYNGFENSIVYAASTGSNQLVKVFLDRLARANVPLADIVTTLLKRVGVLDSEVDVDDLQALSLVGYTVNEKKSLRSIFSELGQVFRFDIVESNGTIIYRTRGSAPVSTIALEDLGEVDDNGWFLQHQEKDFVPSRKINLTYRDIDREYGTNVQSVLLPQYNEARFDEDAAVEVNVPVVLKANDAKTLAEILLYSKIVYQSTYEAEVGPKHLVLDPGDVVSVEVSETETITARVRDMSIGADRQVKLSLSQEDPDIYNDQAALFGVIGRYDSITLPSLDPRIDPLFLVIPFRSDAEAALTNTTYRLYLTFLNYRVGTPPDKTIAVTINGTPVAVPPPVHFPTWGRVMTPLVARTSYYSTDYVSQLKIKLISNSGAALASAASKAALVGNSQMNLAYVGGELIQFETVVDEGDDVYTLTGIHRARFGTEGAVMSHKAGEEFVLLADANGLLDEIAIVPLSVETGDSPLKIYQVFMNTNNPFQPSPLSMIPALNLRPWSLASFKGAYVGNDLVLSWQRRTRFDGQWPDDGAFETVPLNELSETYDLFLFTNPQTFNHNDPSTYLRKVTLTTPTYTYTASEQTADGFNRATTDVFALINQNGSFTGNDAGAAKSYLVEYQR